MKVLLKRILTSLKRDTTARFQELKKDFEPVKPVIEFLRLAALVVASTVGLWPFSQTWVKTYLTNTAFWGILGVCKPPNPRP
jgi:hypothetical protein